MESLRLFFSNGVTEIRFGTPTRQRLNAQSLGTPMKTRCVLLTDQTVGLLYAADFAAALIDGGLTVHEHQMKPGDQAKNLCELERVYDALAKADVGRDGLVIALGGGMVSDLAGFAAATWMRGIAWVAVPTTLEAMVDACIGGKTAINLPSGKNLVGAFHHPKLVLVNSEYLRTLPPREVRAGLAESIKHALLFDEPFFMEHERHAEEILALEAGTMLHLVSTNIRLKAEIVRRDPCEQSGERMLLNFGHTIGHAVEAASGYALRHGECVALGMLAACRIAEGRKMLDAAVVNRAESLLQRFNLPTRVPESMEAESIFSFMHRDKKYRGGRIRFVLLRGIGKPEVVDDISEAEIREGVESIRGRPSR